MIHCSSDVGVSIITTDLPSVSDCPSGGNEDKEAGL